MSIRVKSVFIHGKPKVFGDTRLPLFEPVLTNFPQYSEII
jgi:hypothetical protein